MVGINDIITKPVDADFLYNKIHEWVGEDKFTVISSDNKDDFEEILLYDGPKTTNTTNTSQSNNSNLKIIKFIYIEYFYLI